MMGTWNDSMLTSSATPEIYLRPFALNAGLTSPRLNTMHTAKEQMVRSDIVSTASVAVSKAEEKIGRGPFIQLYFLQAFSNARFVKLKNDWKRFTPTAVLLTVQKSIVLGVKNVSLNWQNNRKHRHTQVNQLNGHHQQKISYQAYLTTRPNVNSIWVLILTLFTCCKFMNNSKASVPYLEFL